MNALDEIKESVAEGYGYYDHASRWRKRNLPHEVKTHLAWLIAEVERLKTENNAFRDGLNADLVSYVLSRVPTKEG